MKLGKWVFAIAALGLIFCGTAVAQYQPNELCINAGSQTWAGGPGYGGYGFPNHGMGKYFPSFTHWTGTEFPSGSGNYPWKINGWGWNCMQGSTTSSYWYWSACLHKSMDNPYDTTVYGTPPNTNIGMGWDYPRNFCQGIGDPGGPPNGAIPDFVFGGLLPGTVPAIGGDHGFVFPSSYGGDDQYWNVFAVTSGGATTAVPTPFTIWSFSISGSCQGIWTAPSSHSIYEYVWDCRPQTAVSQYLNISAYEYDCTGTLGGLIGNKMQRNYTIGGDYDNGGYWGWFASIEGGMCLMLCDIVSLPVNSPGSTVGMNPYSGYGFDTGVAMVCPYATSGCVIMRFMTQANQNPNQYRVVLGALHYPPTPTVPWTWGSQCLTGWSIYGWRIPHAWDFITNLLISYASVFIHIPQPGYPAQFFASSVGSHTPLPVGIPADPILHCMELHFSSMQFPIFGHPVYPDQNDGEPSASFMVTFW